MVERFAVRSAVLLGANQVVCIDNVPERLAMAGRHGINMRIGAYMQAIALQPAHADARVNLGRLFHEDGRLTDAEEQYRAALDAAESPFAAYNLGLILEERREIIEAISAYERALASDAGFADAHFNLARLYENTGDARSAIRHFNAYRLLTQKKPGHR